MRKRPSKTESVMVDTQDQVAEICAACRAQGRFAFDTEFVMEDRYLPEACLLQIATEDTIFLIDPFLELDLGDIWQLVTDPRVETVVHAGQEDLALAVQHTGQTPRRIFDLQLVAGLVGYEYPLSLQRLVQQSLHIRLHKSKTLTDWRKRPLTGDQLRYAAEDVAHLLRIRDKIGDRLGRMSREAWADEENARYEDITLYRRAEEDKLFRVKGAGSLKPRQLAIMRSLLAWRDQLAERYNRPPRVMLKDHLLVEIARHEITEFEDIRNLRGLNLRDNDVRIVGGEVRKALKTPPDSWPSPQPRQEETPNEAVLVALATAVVRSYCLEHKLAYGLVASQRSIKELIRHCVAGSKRRSKDIALLRGWRGETVGVMLDQVLTGQRTVHVEPVEGVLGVHVGRRKTGEGQQRKRARRPTSD